MTFVAHSGALLAMTQRVFCEEGGETRPGRTGGSGILLPAASPGTV